MQQAGNQQALAYLRSTAQQYVICPGVLPLTPVDRACLATANCTDEIAYREFLIDLRQETPHLANVFHDPTGVHR